MHLFLERYTNHKRKIKYLPCWTTGEPETFTQQQHYAIQRQEEGVAQRSVRDYRNTPFYNSVHLMVNVAKQSSPALPLLTCGELAVFPKGSQRCQNSKGRAVCVCACVCVSFCGEIKRNHYVPFCSQNRENILLCRRWETLSYLDEHLSVKSSLWSRLDRRERSALNLSLLIQEKEQKPPHSEAAALTRSTSYHSSSCVSSPGHVGLVYSQQQSTCGRTVPAVSQLG